MPGEADLITVSDVSTKTVSTVQHIAKLLREGKIAGKKFGSFWLTTLEAVEVCHRTASNPGPKPGRELK